MRRCLDAFTPYLILGFGIAFLIGLIYIIAHVVIGGLIIAAMLWGFAFIKQQLFGQQNNVSNQRVYKKHKGIVIEHDEIH